jgi:spore coat protein U-like protein
VKIFSGVVIILSLFLITGICHAGANILTVKAVVLSKNQCKFNSATSALNFGSLDAANPVNKTVATSVVFRCIGSAPNATFLITDNDGLYETGLNANRMRHTTVTTQYLPYSLTYNPQTSTVPKGVDQTLTISGTVLGVDYQDAYVGSYSDTVVLTIEP